MYLAMIDEGVRITVATAAKAVIGEGGGEVEDNSMHEASQ